MKVQAQTATVFGVVRDSLNKPMESVIVSVVGSAGGIETDNRGQFELTVPAEREVNIAFSFIGYGDLRKTLRLTNNE